MIMAVYAPGSFESPQTACCRHLPGHPLAGTLILGTASRIAAIEYVARAVASLGFAARAVAASRSVASSYGAEARPRPVTVTAVAR